MDALADVLLEMGPGDPHAGQAAGRILELELQPAPLGAGPVVLRDLIVFGGVGVKIVFPVELREPRNLAVQQVAREHRQAERLFVGDGQHSGQAEADRADVGVRIGPEGVGATAPHL